MGTGTRRKRGHLPRLMAVAGVSLVASAFAACGSSDSDSGSGAATAGGSATTASSTSGVKVAGRTVTQDPEIRKLFPASILSKGSLSLGYAPTPPRIFQADKGTGALTGVDYDTANAAGALAGLKPELKQNSIEGLIPALEAKKIDVIWSGLLPTPERLKVINIATFTKDAFGLLIQKSNPHNIKGLADMCGLTAAVVQGGSPYLMVVDGQNKKCKAAGKKVIRVRTFTSADTAVLAVKTGQADAEVLITSSAQYLAKSVDGGSAFTAIPMPPYLEGGYGFRKDDAELTKALRAAIQKLMDDGTLTAIMDQYGVGSLALSTTTLHVTK